MPTARKKQIIEKLEERFKKAKGVFFTDYQGLDANTLNTLRGRLATVESEYQVIKNALVKIANPKIGLKGPSAALFSFGNPIAALKILNEFRKSIKGPTFKFGLLEGEIIDAEEMEILAELPSREVLITQTIQLINRPLFSLVNTLAANQCRLVCAIKARANKKGGV